MAANAISPLSDNHGSSAAVPTPAPTAFSAVRRVTLVIFYFLAGPTPARLTRSRRNARVYPEQGVAAGRSPLDGASRTARVAFVRAAVAPGAAPCIHLPCLAAIAEILAQPQAPACRPCS